MLTPHTVRDVMTTDVVAVHPHAAFKDIAILFAHHDISVVPVIDEQRRVVGVISATDLLSKESSHVGAAGRLPPLPGTRQRRMRAKATACRANELMTAPAVTIGPGEGIPAAARVLQARGITTLPVVDAEGTLVGIVGRRDLLSLFVRPDHDIAVEIRQQVLVEALQAEVNSVSADVTDGVVVLNGRVDRRSLVPVAVALTRRVEGVVDVIEHLSFEIDDSAFAPTSPMNADALRRLLPRPR
jgi:CBS-domain-containing membrane protein